MTHTSVLEAQNLKGLSGRRGNSHPCFYRAYRPLTVTGAATEWSSAKVVPVTGRNVHIPAQKSIPGPQPLRKKPCLMVVQKVASRPIQQAEWWVRLI